MKVLKIRWALTFLLVFGITSSLVVSQSGNQLQNGEFSSGISGWQFTGNVAVVNGEAVIGDSSSDYSLLYQPVLLVSGTYQIDFDFRNQLSNNVPDFTAPDTLFSSVYFAQNLGFFDLLNGIFSGGIPLFDLDYGGPFNSFGSIGTSPKGAGWRHFSTTFRSLDNVTVPVFEMFADNSLAGDSVVRIDNVVIQRIEFPLDGIESIPTLTTLGNWVLFTVLILLAFFQLVRKGGMF